MAKATVNERITRVVKPQGVTLELTMDEAQTLRDVLAKVGGAPRESRRRYITAVSRAMEDAGIYYGDLKDMTGSVYFADES